MDDETKGEIPIGRPAKTTGIADAVTYFLSPATSYITGRNVHVDGGFTRSV